MEYLGKDTLLKTPLNYAGTKYTSLPYLIPMFPDDVNTFVDLFAGGCTVATNVKAKTIIANEYQEALVKIYRAFTSMPVASVFDHVLSRIEEFQLKNDENAIIPEYKANYYKFRDFINSQKDPNPLDWYTISCYSYQHSLRFSSRGECSSTYGNKHFNLFLQEKLRLFLPRLQGVQFTNLSFVDFDFKGVTPDDFIYCDPPYLITVADYNKSWNASMLTTLLDKLDEFHKQGLRWGLSEVLTHKGKTNYILMEWRKKYNSIIIGKDYSGINKLVGKNDLAISDEVYIYNY